MKKNTIDFTCCRPVIAEANLIDNSTGVEGLHLNGDIAPQGDLRTGGQYEEWLVDFDEDDE